MYFVPRLITTCNNNMQIFIHSASAVLVIEYFVMLVYIQIRIVQIFFSDIFLSVFEQKYYSNWIDLRNAPTWIDLLSMPTMRIIFHHFIVFFGI